MILDAVNPELLSMLDPEELLMILFIEIPFIYKRAF
jgi:hypothetical protein